MTRIILTAATLVLLGNDFSHAAYVTLVPPGSTNSESTVVGVSGNNVVGNYTAGGVGYGFLYNGANYTTIDFPGSTGTNLTGVSGNNVIGSYSDGGGGIGLLYNSGSYTSIVPPGGINGGASAVSGSTIVGSEQYQPYGGAYGYIEGSSGI